jgi:flagellar biogenesis protein FliO
VRYFSTVTILFLTFFLTVSTLSFAQDEPSIPDAKRVASKLERANELRESQLGKVGMAEGMPRPDEDLGSAAMRMVQSLGVILGLFLIGAWAYKKYILKDTTTLPTARLRVIERLAVSPRGSIMLSEVEGRRVLVGVTPQAISFLDLSTGHTSTTQNAGPHASFIQTLSEEIS